jgi:hypothetical protein
MNLRHCVLIVPILLFGSLIAWTPPPAGAATNAAVGGIGGVNNGTIQNGDGTGPAQFTVDSVDLALVKQARDLNGVVLPPGAGVRPGQQIYFVLYVDNPTVYPSDDLRISDVLNEAQFTYVPGTLETTQVTDGSPDATIWAGTWTPLTDSIGIPDDTASFIDTVAPTGPNLLSIGAVPGQSNMVVTLPGSTLVAFRFLVTVN